MPRHRNVPSHPESMEKRAEVAHSWDQWRFCWRFIRFLQLNPSFSFFCFIEYIEKPSLKTNPTFREKSINQILNEKLDKLNFQQKRVC